MALRLVEWLLLDGVGRNLKAAQAVAGSLGWPWLTTAVEMVSLEHELYQGAQVSPTSMAMLPLLKPYTQSRPLGTRLYCVYATC